MTLEGTNTYIYGADPCAVIDPGPNDAGHLEVVLATAKEQGGLGSILLTPNHGDHSDGAERLAEMAGAGGRSTGEGSGSTEGEPSVASPPVVLPRDGEE